MWYIFLIGPPVDGYSGDSFEVAAAVRVFDRLLWLPPSSMGRTLPVVLSISCSARKKVTVHVCVEDVLLFPLLLQSVMRMRCVQSWKIDSEGVKDGEKVLAQAPEVLSDKQSLMNTLAVMKEKGAALEATRHLATSLDLQTTDHFLKYVSMVSKFVRERCVGWHKQRDGLPGGMGAMHTWDVDFLQDPSVQTRLADFVTTEEAVTLYKDYKVLKQEITLASRIFDCFDPVECCREQHCTEELQNWEVEADTFVDCLVLSQVQFAGCKAGDSQRLERLRRAQSITKRLPVSFSALLREDIDRMVVVEQSENAEVS